MTPLTNSFNPFDNVEVEYIWQPYWTFINPQNGNLDYNYFDQYKNKLVVINFASENWNNFENSVYELLDNAGINFLILTYDYAKHQKYPRMFYYPHWYQLSRSFWASKSNHISVNKNKNYYLGCLNGRASNHRIANFLKLKKQPYWNNTCISFYNDVGSRPNDFELFDNEIAEWGQIHPTLSKKSWEPLDTLTAPQLIDSYLHLTTETTIVPTVFISEKTWKPIAATVPFVVWGNPGTMNLLKRLGVDTYDDVIDHKYYDQEEDARLRLDKLHDIINDLIFQGVDKIYNQLFARSADNQKKYFQGDFGQTYHNMVIDAIKKYS